MRHQFRPQAKITSLGSPTGITDGGVARVEFAAPTRRAASKPMMATGTTLPGIRDERPIEDYGLIGDTRCAALVASDGSIDWMCMPRFDGPPVFGRLVGGPEAGSFGLGPSDDATVIVRRYRPQTASLQTTWRTPSGRLTLTEGMVAEVAGSLLPSTLLVRRLTAEDGPVEAVINFDPHLGERRRAPTSRHRGDILVCSWAATAVAVHCSPPVRLVPGHPVTVTISPGVPLTVVLGVAEREPLVYVDADTAWAALKADKERWQRWCKEIDDELPYRDIAVRSLLTLRLLPIRRRVRPLPHQPPRFPNAWAETATGTIASPGLATPASVLLPSSAADNSMRRVGFWPGS